MSHFSFRQGVALALLGAFGVCAAGQTQAQAQTSGRTLSECRAIEEDAARLACYDSAHAQFALQPSRQEGYEPGYEVGAGRGLRAEQATGLKESKPKQVAAASGSMIDDAWGFNPDSDPYLIKLYHPNYLLFARYTDSVNNRPFSPLFSAADLDPKSLDATEAAFQLSFKARLWAAESRRLGVWFAYTQQSHWQVYNTGISSPFRDTNYMPELFVSYQPDIGIGDFKWKLLNVGYAHQSNGRSDPISRSWDRVFAEFGFERDDLGVFLKAWYRIPEDKEDDDNSDITDYYGHGQITVVKKWRDHKFSLMARGNPRTGKGAGEFSWITPPLIGPLRGYVKAFSGYGETMIDYNWQQNTIGVGVTIGDDMM